jgi:23S rRNA (adenine2503-C2)-methyltransferase
MMPAAVDLLALSSTELTTFLQKLDFPRYRTTQVLRWLYQHQETTVLSMTDLSKPDRDKLARACTISSLDPVRTQQSVDGTEKAVFALSDGKTIETVVIPDEDRLTACLSTQVGCTLDCGFCMTGQMGLLRNLRPHEIVGQVLAVQRRLSPPRHLTNVVFMGMGEPLANFDAVAEAIRRLTNTTWGLGFSPRRITLSTAGWASRIKRVADLGVNLAVSLNATTNAQRARLMPMANQAHSLERVLKACREFPLQARRRLTFEYVLLEGENDSAADAIRLAKLVRGMRCKINLIPFNEFPDSPFRRPSEDTVLHFQNILKAHGLDVFIRKSKGRDVLGACGQLGGSSTLLRLHVERENEYSARHLAMVSHSTGSP